MDKRTIQNSEPGKILIVEDSHVQADALRHLLEENRFDTSLAYNGMDGIKKLENENFSLIISDILMPGIDGYEFCLKVKSDARFRNIPFILLTELSDSEDIIKGLQCGADNFITKPYSNDNLLNRINHLLVNSELRKRREEELSLEVFFKDEKYIINSDRRQILDLLISVFEAAIERNRELLEARESQQRLIELLTLKKDELDNANFKLKEINDSLEERIKARTMARDKEIAKHLLTIEALRLSEDKYRMLTERMTDILWTADINLKLTYISPSVERILSFTSEEKMKRSIDEMLTPESLILVQKSLNDELEKEKTGADPNRIIAIELHVYHKNGTVRIFDNSITIIRDRQGQLSGFQGMSRDITANREMSRLLFDREEKLQSIIKAINDWIWEVDSEGYYTYSSPQSLSILGFSPEEIIGKTPYDLMPPEEAARIGALYRKMASEAKPFNGLENINIKKNGETIILETNGVPFFAENGVLAGYRGIDRDITKRKESDKLFRKTADKEKAFNRILKIFLSIPDDSVYNEVLNVILDISGSSMGLLGFIEDNNRLVIPSLKGNIMKECRVKDSMYNFHLEMVNENILGKSIITQKTICSNEPLTKIPDGHVQIDNCVSVPVIFMENVIGLLSVANRKENYGDEEIALLEEVVAYISPIMKARMERDRKEKELIIYQQHLEELVTSRTAELMKERDRIDTIIRSVPDGVIVTDMQQRIILMNHSAEELLGICFQRAQNQPISSFIDEETLREKLKHVIESFETECEFDFIFQNNNDDSERIIHGKTSIIADSDEKKHGTVTIMSDVTNLREVDRMKTEFLSTAAHELRTPLTSIQGFSEILLTRDNINEFDRKKYLNYINKQAVKLAKIVADLLDVARIESGKGFSINRENCLIRTIVSDIIPYFESFKTKHKFELCFPEEPVTIFVDKNLIEQVLKNLINNSIKYSSGEGIIRIEGKKEDSNFLVSVEDHGIGMTPEQLDRMFEKFYRVDNSDSAPEGTGLGMTIVKYIIEKHGGKIWIESVYERGTKVFFTIPLGEYNPCQKD